MGDATPGVKGETGVVGVIGLGNIGGAIATNLVADGHRRVVVHDADADPARAVAGATAAAAVTGGGRGGRHHAPVAADAGDRRRRSPPPGPRRRRRDRSSSTSPPTARPRCASSARRLAASGHHLVEAPLTGGAIGAERRMLVFMVGGDAEAVDRVRPVLEPLGRAMFHVGELGLGNTMKLLNSLIAYTTTWVSLEGLSMAAKAGVPVPDAVEILRTAGASNFYLDRMVETHRRPGPAHAVRPRPGRQGRRPHRRHRRRRSACPPRWPPPCWASCSRPSPPASATPTGASWWPWPSSRPTSSSAGTRPG